MKLVGRVPVEPLDDERMTNIERRVVAGAADAAARPSGLRAPRRFLGFAAAAMAAMAAGVIGWKLGGSPAQTPVVAEAPITITTDANRGTLSIGDATIQSDPSTVFVVTRPDGGVLVDLSKGKVELEVAKRGNRPPLVVRAGDTDVIVVGTHFSVDYGDGTGEVDVRVTEGVVKVVRHKQESRVAMGQAWETKRGVIALADARPARGSGGATASGTTNTGSGEIVGSTIGEVATGSGAVEIQMGNGPDVLHGRTSQVPDGRTPAVQRTGSGGSNSTAATSKPEGQQGTKSGSGSGSGDLRAQIRRQEIMPPLDVGETVSATAVLKYQWLIRDSKTGEEESRAYYGIAYTQALKLKRTGDALQTITIYERRFAQGRVYPERDAIAWLKLWIVCTERPEGPRGEACRQAATAYNRLSPDSPARHVSEKITLVE